MKMATLSESSDSTTMSSRLPVHLAVVGLLLKLSIFWLFGNLFHIIWSTASSIIYFTSGAWILKPIFSSLGYFFHLITGQGGSNGSDRNKRGIVILTRVPIQDRVKSTSTVFSGLKNSCFLERVMAESMAHMLTRMRAEEIEMTCTDIDENEKSSGHNHSMSKKTPLTPMELFVCYKLNYTCSYEIKDWLERLPDYDKKLDEVEISPEEAQVDLDALRPTIEANRQCGPDLNFDPDSYCRNRPEQVPGSQPNRPRVFHYVSVEGRQMERLVEVAIRAAFGRGCGLVVVLNPRVPGVTPQHIRDAMSALTGQNGEKENDVVMGRTKWGGVYLLGVTWNKETALHLRRFTGDVMWTSTNAYARLSVNLSRLGWRGVSLRAVLEEVDSVDSLHLVPQYLGLPIEHTVSDEITVIVPTLNCEDHITTTLESIVENSSKKRKIQILIVDGRSTDQTLTKIEEFKRNLSNFTSPRASPKVGRKSRNSPCKHHIKRRRSVDSVLVGQMGITDSYNTKADNMALYDISVHTLPSEIPATRGEQCRWAASSSIGMARGASFLFLQPGTHLPLYWDTAMLRCLSRLGVVLGAFSFHLFLQDKYIQRKNIPWALRCYFLDVIFNWRSCRLEMPLGEQGFFMHAYYYRLIGGYPTEDVVDDVQWVEQCRQHGHVGISQASVTVWPIRVMRHGFCRTLLLDSMLWAAYKLGASADTLSQFQGRLDIIDPEYLDGY